MPFFPKKIANPYNSSIIEVLPKTTEKSPKTAANIKKTILDSLPLSIYLFDMIMFFYFFNPLIAQIN